MTKKLIKNRIKVFVGYLKNEDGFGMYEIIGTAAVLIVAAFVLIPGFRLFASTVMGSLNSWFTDTIAANIFPTA